MDQGLLFDRLIQKLRSEFHPILADPMLFHNPCFREIRGRHMPGTSENGTGLTLAELLR
jgi:hypothetical protein